MTDVEALLERCRTLGVEFAPGEAGVLRLRAPHPVPEQLKQEIRQYKQEILRRLTKPYLNRDGELIVPVTAEPKYRWWLGGQSLYDTLQELGASPAVIAKYVEPDRVTLQ